MKNSLLVAPLLAIAFPLLLSAQTTDDPELPAVAYTTSGTARFFPVAKEMIVPPGGHVVQVLNVFGMERASIQAVAHSTQGDALFHVRIGFGPPHVFDPAARLDLGFTDTDTARAASITPVRGPRMAVVLDNERAVPVTVSVGVYASN
jgi:hypothetical protein